MSKKIYEIIDLDDYKNENKDLFNGYDATIEKLDGNDGRDCIITFKRTDTVQGSMRFIYINGVLSVNGDYGYAVYNWYNKNNHISAYGRFNSFGYILSKIVASGNYKKFSEELFFKEFDDWKQHLVDDGYITLKEKDLIEKPHSICNENDVVNYFDNFDTELIDDIYEFGVYEFGAYVSERPYIWWYGLQTALKILEEKGEL